MTDKIQSIDIKALSEAMSQICDEKGLRNEKILEIVGCALAAAYKKDYGAKGQIIKAQFNPKDQTVVFSQIKEVVDKTTRAPEKTEDSSTKSETSPLPQVQDKREALPYFNKERDIYLKDAKKIKKDVKVGDEVVTNLKSETKFGRVAAQNAKQVIIQKLREAEKEILYEEFKNKEGKVITATVQQVEGSNVNLDLGKMVGVLAAGEQVHTEHYRAGQKLKVYVKKVNNESRDTAIILSRSNPNLVKQLFALEVPEIFTGSIVIESIAREAGSRSKIAIQSKEEGIDPVGSCIGQKGIRVQAIIDELGGEKIDIVKYSSDPKIFITNALSPATVKLVRIPHEDKKRAVVYVDPDQFSLAIGRSGQNVRLATNLTGWSIDITDKEPREIIKRQSKDKKERKKGKEGRKKIKKLTKDKPEKKDKEDKKKSIKTEKEVKKSKTIKQAKKAKAKIKTSKSTEKVKKSEKLKQ